MLARIYPKQYKGSPAQRNVSAITFAGTVLGTLAFGVCSLLHLSESQIAT